MNTARQARGQSSAEFALILPAAFLMIFAVVEMALIGVRGVAVEYAATRAARVRTVYQDGFAGAEANAALPAPLFEGALAGIDPEDGGRIVAVAKARTFFRLGALSPAEVIRRSAPGSDALAPSLSDVVLQGGDSASPYCEGEERYRVCGYPK